MGKAITEVSYNEAFVAILIFVVLDLPYK